MSNNLPAPSPSPEDPTERFEMRANFAGLIQLLARNLYAEPDVFVRELVQNAHDGIRLRQQIEPGHAGRIEIELKPAERLIVIRDDGLGMDRSDIKEFLSVIGSTGTGIARGRLEEANQAAAFTLIGQFGIGLLSAFVVAERVTVQTRKLGSAESWVWVNEGRTDCRLIQGAGRDVGTEITLLVAREHQYMLQQARISEAVVRYCDFLPLPVFLNGKGPLNLVRAPWDRPGWPSEEAREAAYRDFVRHRYPDTPLEVIPIEIEEPVRARGALYISDRRIPDLDTAGVVDIFVRRMMVRPADAELLPPWAKFIRGMVECPDLQPTAARDNVRRDDWAYETLRQRLGELIIERLSSLATENPTRFREINRWHHYHLKGMALFHEEFFQRVAGLLLFETNRGMLPLEELFRDDGVTQSAPVFYFAKPGAAPQFFPMGEARGWVVIDASRIFEKELVERYARASGAARRLVALDAGDHSALFEVPKAAPERCRRLEADVEAALVEVGLDNVSVQVCRFAPERLPAVVLLSTESEAELQLEALVQQPWFVESLAGVTREVLRMRNRRPLRLRLNENNGLIAALLRPLAPTPDRSACVGLYLSAALNARDLLADDTVAVFHGELLTLLTDRIGASA